MQKNVQVLYWHLCNLTVRTRASVFYVVQCTFVGS